MLEKSSEKEILLSHFFKNIPWNMMWNEKILKGKAWAKRWLLEIWLKNGVEIIRMFLISPYLQEW